MSAERAELLSRINRDLPPERDWKAGALTYLEQALAADRDGVMRFVLTKPLHFSTTIEALDEARWYLRNFVNVLDLLGRKPGARVLDVACGGGWVSHFLRRLGFETLGFDISHDFVAAAKRRLLDDRHLDLREDEIEAMFIVHDIEERPLVGEPFDFILLESCLHHFFDPVGALTHLAGALAPDGVLVCIEGENRVGPIKDEYVEVMKTFDTIERPYARADLIDALRLAGFPEVEFVNSIDGWRSPTSGDDLNVELAQRAALMNLALCATEPGPLDAIVPSRRTSARVSFEWGAYADEGTHRWLGPAAQILARDAGELIITFISHAAAFLRERQEVVVYGPDGVRGRLYLEPSDRNVRLSAGRLAPGEGATITSPLAFTPRWTGGDDNRLLSLAVTTALA